MLVNTMLIIFFLLRLVIGARLIVTARQNNLPNLYWLGGLFFTVAIGAAFAPSAGNPLGGLPIISLWMFSGTGSILPAALVLIFTQTTFYRGRPSLFGWYASFYAIFAGLAVYGLLNSPSNYQQHPWVAFITFGSMLAWFWHGWSAYQALKNLSKEQMVEDWIKSRYRLIMAYSALLIMGQIGSLIRILFVGGSNLTPLGNAMGLFTISVQITAITLQFLVWVMPESFRKWLNRSQKIHISEQTHKQAQLILDIISSAIAEEAGLPKIVALFTLRKAIGQSIHSEDTNQIEAHALTLGYHDWFDFLDHSELHILIETSPATGQTHNAIARAKSALAERQSLFTMQAK